MNTTGLVLFGLLLLFVGGAAWWTADQAIAQGASVEDPGWVRVGKGEVRRASTRSTRALSLADQRTAGLAGMTFGGLLTVGGIAVGAALRRDADSWDRVDR